MITPLKKFKIKQKKKADRISERNAKRKKWILNNLLFSSCPECNSSFKDARFSYIENGRIGYVNTTCDVSCSCGLTLVVNKKFFRNKWKITETNM